MNRNIALDLLKLSMAFMIVGLHAGFLGDISSLANYLTVNGIFRVAVPIFLIINGFYFYPVLSKRNQTNWLKRVLILHVFWTVIYMPFWLQNTDFSLAIILIKNFIIGYYHLWYLPGMIGAAIILILMHKLSSVFLIISVLLTFMFGVLMQYISNYHFIDNELIIKILNYNWIYRNALFFSYPFFCVGYLINKHTLHSKISFQLTLILSAIGGLFLIVESYVNYYRYGRDGGFDMFLSLIFVCPLIFILFVKLNISSKSKYIALYSSSIYFIHLFILNIYREYSEFNGTTLTIFTLLTSILLSSLVIKMNGKLKIIL